MQVKEWVYGTELSETKGVFSASSKRFINAHKEDIELTIYDNGNVRAFYGESCGFFMKRNYQGVVANVQWVHDSGNLYKAEIISKIVNELMQFKWESENDV